MTPDRVVPDRWLVLCVRLPRPADRDAIADELLRLGGSAVEERNRFLTTYVAPPDDVNRLLRGALGRLRDRLNGREPVLRWRWRENEDWTARWRLGLGPRRVGRRIVVAPRWSRPELRPGDIAIAVDPEMAFGTGEHATTRGALRLLERTIRPGDHVLDLGTGSGILAIAAAELGAAGVLAVERDARALENTRRNLAHNGVAGRVALAHATVDERYLARLGSGCFDVVTANILSGVLRPLLPGLGHVLAPAGRLVLAGILHDEAAEMDGAAERAGLTLHAEDREAEWWAGWFESGASQG